jgi:hypothetical protein
MAHRPAERQGRFLFVLVMIVSIDLVWLAGCGTTVPEIKPKGHATITFAPDGRFVEAKVDLFNEVLIELPPPDNPQHTWTIVLNDARFLKLEREVAPDPNHPGEFVATFLAIRVGKRRVRFLAVPSGMREAVSSELREAIVEIR